MSETLNYDNLLAGSQKPPVNRPATIRMGENFARGSLIGKLTATQKWQEIAFAGKATCDDFGIATEDVDSSAAEVASSVFVEGEFGENHVVFFYGDTKTDWRETLVGHGIYLRSTLSVVGQ